MFRKTVPNYVKRHYTWRDRIGNAEHKYREAAGYGKQKRSYDHSSIIPGRLAPQFKRFNPANVLHTKGTSGNAWRWWHTQQALLPNAPPKDYAPPKPRGFVPNKAWNETFRKKITSMSDEALKRKIINRLSVVIFEETQRDGYELRKLDFEGRPLEKMPEKRIIEQFVFEEETLRDRVIGQVVETDFRLNVTSEERLTLKSVENITNYIIAHVTVARKPPSVKITHAVRDVLAAQPVQPLLGFHHALPKDSRARLIVEWERMHQLDWQFGKAVYTPRSKEVTRGNLEWMRTERANERRQDFDGYVSSGQALADHKARIAQAAAM